MIVNVLSFAGAYTDDLSAAVAKTRCRAWLRTVFGSELYRFHRSLFCKLEYQDMYRVHVLLLDLHMIIFIQLSSATCPSTPQLLRLESLPHWPPF